MHCSMSDEYLDKANSESGLVQFEKEALEDIQASFNIPATYGISTNQLCDIRYRISDANPLALFLRNPLTSGGRFLDAPKRLFILQHYEWLANRRLTRSPSSRGRHIYEPALTLLHENGDNYNSWCRKTLIHETLHSVSLYSRIYDKFPNVILKHYKLIEGITECLTGYVLLEHYQECYNGWKKNQLYRCSISYRPSVRLWCSFCQIVGIMDLAKFYLSSQIDFVNPWEELVQSVHSAGFAQFAYELDEKKAFNEPQFREVCVRSLPGFKKIYDSSKECFDFSKIS